MNPSKIRLQCFWLNLNLTLGPFLGVVLLDFHLWARETSLKESPDLQDFSNSGNSVVLCRWLLTYIFLLSAANISSSFWILTDHVCGKIHVSTHNPFNAVEAFAVQSLELFPCLPRVQSDFRTFKSHFTNTSYFRGAEIWGINMKSSLQLLSLWICRYWLGKHKSLELVIWVCSRQKGWELLGVACGDHSGIFLFSEGNLSTRFISIYRILSVKIILGNLSMAYLKSTACRL